jgi:hypothetical protein
MSYEELKRRETAKLHGNATALASRKSDNSPLTSQNNFAPSNLNMINKARRFDESQMTHSQVAAGVAGPGSQTTPI